MPLEQPHKFSWGVLRLGTMFSNHPKISKSLYIYVSILELDKLFLGTCVDLHLNIRNATSSRTYVFWDGYVVCCELKLIWKDQNGQSNKHFIHQTKLLRNRIENKYSSIHKTVRNH